jgi:phospholipase C
MLRVMTMRRRDALKTIGSLAGAATMSRFLPACGGSSGPEGITTIVAMMMENRSFDHLMGSRTLLEGKNEDGLTASMANPNRLGVSVPIWKATADTMCVIDPPHGWDPSRVQLGATGMCDGFLEAHQDAHNSDTAIEPMQYLVRDQVPTSYGLADAYTLCNRWFSSVLGPTYPNRFYWHSAQSNGFKSNMVPSMVWPTVYDRLNAAGIPWSYYYGDLPVLSLLGSAADGHIKRFEDFATDAKQGVLPPVVYIDPAFSINDDHPPHHPSAGQQLIGAVYAALAQSPQWKNILFVVTYDEHGGFFDHVAPPKTADDRAADGFDQLGFRVPTIVAGPYVKQGLDSTVYDHTSVLRHIERMFDLEPLTARDAAATDLSNCIDQERLAKHAWNPPADVPMVTIDESTLPAECMGKGSGVAPGLALWHHDVLEWADANPALLRGWDRRGDLRSYLECIHELLAPHGGGVRWGR